MKQKPIYTVQCKKAYDGDAFGNEWKCGVSIYKTELGFDIYEDDGKGNGNFLIDFTDELSACAWAKLHCDELDKDFK